VAGTPAPISGGGSVNAFSPTPTPNPVPTLAYLDGTLVLDRGTIFILEYGKKRAFSSMDVFNSLGYKLSNVVNGATDNIPDGQGMFSKTQRHVRGAIINDGGTVYFVGAQIRYAFPSAEVFLSWGLRFQDVVAANNEDLKMAVGPIVEMKK
jgi:hypothetical protein